MDSISQLAVTVMTTGSDDEGWTAYNSKNYPILGLVSEVGELASELKKVERNDRGVVTPERKANIEEEIGDVLWYLMAICLEHDIPMARAIRKNNEKLMARLETGTIKER